MLINIRNCFICLIALILSCNQIEMTFDEYPVYNGSDLGFTYTPEKTIFKVWSPNAQQMMLKIYEEGQDSDPVNSYQMNKASNGLWQFSIEGDQKGIFYTYQATVKNVTLQETSDPYSKAVGVNGLRSAVIDLNQTNPDGWESDTKPPLDHFKDIILYELHVRDFSIHPESGMQHKGKFLAFTEEETSIGDNATGLAHLKELGITHVHLLPSFDYSSIDESKLNEPQFNWGYDPANYNVPEGSYSTDPYIPEVRIKEFKELVLNLHKNGLRVIMDVVYNHTYKTDDSNFNLIAPGYYYRQNEEGKFSDASGCGNETASDREMMRKFIKESVAYWANEYHIDGFRFDLMGIHDIKTMEEVTDTLNSIDPTIYVYGEGWTAGASPLSDSLRAIKANTYQMSKVAAFNDEMRDGIKGHWADKMDRGFVSGMADEVESVKYGIVGAIDHPGINFEKVNYSKSAWAREPWQCINYVACHDDYTLWDKLEISTDSIDEYDEEVLVKMDLLANTMVLTSQGVPFLHAGAELLRTKNGDHNSYKSPDSVNQIDWTRKKDMLDVFAYYQGLIALRKAHPGFRLRNAEAVIEKLSFPEVPEGILAFQISGIENDPSWESILVICNANLKEADITISQGQWEAALYNMEFYDDGKGSIHSNDLTIPPVSGVILHK